MQLVIIGLAAGIATGTISGLVGIGGGVLLVPILLYVFKIDMHAASGTSLAIIIPTAIVGAYSHFARGSVDWKLAAFISLGAIMGAALGTWFAYALPASTLKKLFAVILLIVSFSILLDAYGIGLNRVDDKPATAAAEVTAAQDSSKPGD